MKKIIIMAMIAIIPFALISCKSDGCGCSTGPNECRCSASCECEGVDDGNGNLRCACHDKNSEGSQGGKLPLTAN